MTRNTITGTTNETAAEAQPILPSPTTPAEDDLPVVMVPPPSRRGRQILWLTYLATLFIAVVAGGVALFGLGVNDVDLTPRDATIERLLREREASGADSTPRDATIERLLRESEAWGRIGSAPHDSVIERLVRERSDR